MIGRIAVLAVTLALGPASNAAAQLIPPDQQPPRPRVQPLQPATPGTPLFAQRIADLNINVFTLEGRKHSGYFTIHGKSLVSRDQMTVIPFDQIRRVEKNSFRMRLHSLIGAGVGAGLAPFVMSGCGKRPGKNYSECGFAFLLSAGAAGVGAAIGSAVGGTINIRNEPSDLIFERPGLAPASIAFVPMLSPMKKGLGLAISWR